MGELSRQDLRQLQMLMRTEIGKAYELVILPKLQSVDGKLETLLEARDDHKRLLERLEIWRDSLNGTITRDQYRYNHKGVVSLLLLAVATFLSVASGLLLVWLSRISH